MRQFTRAHKYRLQLMPWLLMGAALLTASCGYHVAGSVRNLPGGIHSIGIPTFKNDTRVYKIEQQVTAAVLKEFTLRTRVPVNSRASGVDAVLEGEIHNLNSSPVTFGTQAFASAFLVTVEISVKLVRVSDGKVIWENPSFTFRNRYILNSNVAEFFSEENPAVDRLAQDFAASLVSSILIR